MSILACSPPTSINSTRPTKEELAAFYAAHEAFVFHRSLDEVGDHCYWLFRSICEMEPTAEGVCTIELGSELDVRAGYVLAAFFANMRVEWGEGGVYLIVSRPAYHIDGSIVAYEGMKAQEERHAMPYKDYLQSEFWQDKRDAVLKSARYRCQVCNASGKLHVHHRTYEHRGYEYPSDLIALCPECHKLFHDHRELQKEDS